MLSTIDVERLIAEKKAEIEKEKYLLGLLSQNSGENKENTPQTSNHKNVNFTEDNIVLLYNEKGKHEETEKSLQDLEEHIPHDLERYIRRYIGLPIMLKAGEYSPNNPLIRSERHSGDVLLGLGEYERRRNTLRKIRQQQYREYLDQQAKKKQEEKEQAERERRERQEKEREQEERERERDRLERQRSPELRRASYCYTNEFNDRVNNKVDTGVQVNQVTCPLSVAVQTDNTQIFNVAASPLGKLTEAERELSPRAVLDLGPHCYEGSRRKSYGDFDDPPYTKRRERLSTELRHTYMPSIFDAEAIHLRNLQAEKEAAVRRQFYQQELKNQIIEQQRIREERKAREKMLEQAEMRRLEEQLRMLKAAQEYEVDKNKEITHMAKEDAVEYNNKKTTLQKEIDIEQNKLLRAKSQPNKVLQKRNTQTSHSDFPQLPSKLPFYYPSVFDKNEGNTEKRPPYSTNIPDSSIFSPNYDVDGYLRRNLNPSKESLRSKIDYNLGYDRNSDYRKNDYEFSEKLLDSYSFRPKDNYYSPKTDNILIEKALVQGKSDKLPNIAGNDSQSKGNKDVDTLPIPVLRHSPKSNIEEEKVCDVPKSDLSDAMKLVNDKWKVPAVQKNILQPQLSREGKNVSILTQLGSIRRQLQLEQLKLDQMISKDKQ